MILFKDDWKRQPGIIDFNTSNKSFLRLSYLLNKMGVKNSTFMLALHQPKLRGVDPHDPDLTPEIKAAIIQEVRFNPWYFFREVVRFPPSAGTDPVPFNANRANISAIWCFFNHIDYVLIQPRQTGKTGSVNSLIIGLLDIWTFGTKFNYVTKGLDTQTKTIADLKEIRLLIPTYIHYPDKTDVNNSQAMSNNRHGNRFTTAVGQASEQGAERIGRGLTTAISIFDELAFINNNKTIIPASLAAGGFARDQAKENGQPYGNVFMTTAGSLTSKMGRYAYQFMMDGSDWNDKFYDARDEEDLRSIIIGQASKKGVCRIYGVFSHRQLGYTDEWVREKILTSSGDAEQAGRDYLNQWTTGSQGSPLTIEQKGALSEYQRDPDAIEILEQGYMIKWYVPERQREERMAQGHYVIGLDTSDALGGGNDPIAMVVKDVYTDDTIAVALFNETSLSKFALFIADFMLRYKNTTLVFERRSSGPGIVDMLIAHLVNKGEDPFRRIHNKIASDPANHQNEYQEICKSLSRRDPNLTERYKRYLGFATSGSGQNSRNELYISTFQSMLRTGAHRIYDKRITMELLGLEVKNGRIDHSSGNHDDHVIATLLTHWFLTKTQNLKFYGIDAKNVFVDAPDQSKLSTEDRIKANNDDRFRQEFQNILELIKQESDPAILTRLDGRIRRISANRDIESLLGDSLDALLEKAKDNKRRQAIKNRAQNKSIPFDGSGRWGGAVPRPRQRVLF